MRKGLVIVGILLAINGTSLAQTDSLPANHPSEEAFINEVFRTVVDSSFSHYYLSDLAMPGSFVIFDYDDWLDYNLDEIVPIFTLNDLAKKVYEDRKRGHWRQDSLQQAICINDDKITAILDPLQKTRPDSTLSAGKKKRIMKKIIAAWMRQPADQKIVYYFSRPAFTDDGQYAVIDMDYRCDGRLCGMGSICIFRRTFYGWRLIGRKIVWGT